MRTLLDFLGGKLSYILSHRVYIQPYLGIKISRHARLLIGSLDLADPRRSAASKQLYCGLVGVESIGAVQGASPDHFAAVKGGSVAVKCCSAIRAEVVVDYVAAVGLFGVALWAALNDLESFTRHYDVGAVRSAELLLAVDTVANGLHSTLAKLGLFA